MEPGQIVALAVTLLGLGGLILLATRGRRRRRAAIAGTGIAAVLLSLTGAAVSAAPQRAALPSDTDFGPLATDEAPSFELIPQDLEFILEQIQISEAHAERFNGGDTSVYSLLCRDRNDTSGKCVRDPMLPFGLRTVDGSFNNLQFDTTWGKSNKIMPRLLPTQFREADPTAPRSPLPDGDRSMCEDPTSSCYEQTDGTVYDAEPRVISNLIVDSTTANPAAQDAITLHPGAEASAEGEVFVPNMQSDEGLSAPVNLFFVLFGQFFDHGLDLVNKGGNGQIIVPLAEDDPLYASTPPNMRFMVLDRATNQPDGSREHENRTTPWVDQNQTYTSHPSHQVFLREYALEGGVPVDTGRLLNGPGGEGLARWADVKTQAREVLGIDLSDRDVLSVPQVVVDLYGNFIPGPNGFPQLMTDDNVVVEGDPTAPISTADAVGLNQSFLDDIAHGAVPSEDLSGYDNVLLGEHFVSGDGRSNENIGLTAVHHVFHAEHNRLVQHIEDVLVANPDLRAAYQDQSETDDWSYAQRLFQAARFANEMQYQHLVFEEFARTIQPAIDVVTFNENSYDTTIDGSIKAEFAHVVYRFGHSMLTQDLNREGFGSEPASLLDGFLNPVAFHCATAPDVNNACPAGSELSSEDAAGALINGTTNQVANQIDELMTSTLRNNLLGLPLDLATINLMRGRDVGVPPLQVARAEFFAASGNPNLRPYTSWEDFGLSLRNGENFGRGESQSSLINFVAAYGTHPSVQEATTVAAKRTAARVLVEGAGQASLVDRISGANRWGTAAAISRSAFASTVETVFIANGRNFPDALAGGPASAVEGAPVLLVEQNAIPLATAMELARLKPSTIKVLGGTAAVSDEVLGSLETDTSATVERLAGSNRYSTATAISTDTFTPAGTDTVFLASGENYPDALSGGAAAGHLGAPLLLTNPTGLPAVTRAEIERLQPSRVVVLGGTTAVSAAVATSVAAIPGVTTVDRLHGANRWATSAAISADVFADSTGGTVYLATGRAFPDALAAAGSAGLQGAPVLLVPGDSSTIPDVVQEELLRLAPSRIVVLGGEAAVTAAMADAVQALLPVPEPPADRTAFMTGAAGSEWADVDGQTVTGLENVDFWVGGLAEAVDPFGGMLGSTFNYVFEKQLEDLQFGDRFYYLFRNQGNHLFHALEANSFSSLIQRNTNASLLPADIFLSHGPFIDLENLSDPPPAGLVQSGAQWRWNGDEHIEIHGHRTLSDNIRGGQGDDALWGYGGDDRIEGGSGNDAIVGGPGDDILTDAFGDDNIKGGPGHDAIDGGPGIDLLLGGPGNDFVRKSADNADGASAFLGTGNDIYLGGTGRDTPFGNEGDDWLEGGPHSDLLVGDNGQQFQNDLNGGDDVLIGGDGSDDMDAEGGDDIMVGSLGGTDRFHGMYGWDSVTYYGTGTGVDADLNFNLLQPPDVTAIRDRYTEVEALSGGSGNDVLRGLGLRDDRQTSEVNRLTEEGIALIGGLGDLLRPAGHDDYALRFMGDPSQGDGGTANLIMGGPGSDLIEGRFGDDFIDGDAMLRVRLQHGGQYYDSARQLATGVFNGSINPGDIQVVRDIVVTDDGSVDTAVYADTLESYTIEDLGDGYYRITLEDEDEGSDVVRNVEMVQFSDGCLVVDGETPPAEWAPCTEPGTVALGGQTDPAGADQAVTAELVLEDADGAPLVENPTEVRFTWQVGTDGQWKPAPTGDSLPDSPDGQVDTFVPGDGDPESQLRVVVTYVDDAGTLRTVTSDPLPQAAGSTG